MTRSTLSHAELVVLALLGEGPTHAYDLVRRIDSMEIKRWAKVADSTVYAVLPRLEERGFVEGEEEPGRRRKTRTAYRPTEKGRERLESLIDTGLSHPGRIHSDRLVAGIFAAGRGNRATLEQAADDVREEREAIRAACDRRDLSEFGWIVLSFYARVSRAHLQALESLLDAARDAGEPSLSSLEG